jgi:hypothetical protein
MRSVILIILGMLATASAEPEPAELEGYWAGALMREGSVLLLEVELEETDGGLISRTTVPEWYWYRGIERPAEATENGLRFELFFADREAELAYDQRHQHRRYARRAHG